MVSTTSGTTTFNLDVDDIIDQAYEPLDMDLITGIDASKARRTLNLILIQLQNKNIPLSKIEQVDQALSDGTNEYQLDGSIVDVLDMNIFDPADPANPEIPINRESLAYFHNIPYKSQEQRPTLFTTDRDTTYVYLKVWPTPDKTYTAKMQVSKRVEDVTASYQKVDISYRYLPLLIKWLSYELAINTPSYPLDKVLLLEKELNRVMPDSFEEDRERVDFTIKPGGISGK